MFLAGAAFWTLSAAAQSSQGTPSIQHSESGPEKDLKFEVLSIRSSRLPSGGVQGIPNPTPNGHFTTTANMWQMVVFAYGPPGPAWMWTSVKMDNEPGWFREYYAIDARVAQADLKAWQGQSGNHELLRFALRAALKERCKLAIHDRPSQERIYELVVAKGGPGLRAAAPGAALPVGVKLESGGVMTGGAGAQGRDDWNFRGATMQDLAFQLSIVSPGTPVRDRTGLAGRYDFSVRRIELQPGDERVYSYPVDHLGLRLRPGKENRPILVIDHVEKPSPN
jgi:uncharacterized protein (TIGR03435 family)